MAAFLKKIIPYLERRIFFYLRYPEFMRWPSTDVREDSYHLDNAMGWLAHAQDNGGGRGVSAFYGLLNRKWRAPYRETTGYIIPTFLAYSDRTGEKKFLDRAIAMGDWELQEMTSDGAVGEPQKDGTIQLKTFNTGQVVFGLCSLFDHTGDKKYIEAADRSAHWLLRHQEPDGTWIQFSNDGANGIDSRVSWALLEVWKRTGEETYKTGAQKQLAWVLAQQNEAGWFKNSSLRDRERPWTHAIVYTISGLLESSFLLDDSRLFDAARKAADATLSLYTTTRDFPYFPGTLDAKWHSDDKYSCLTGDAQIAIVWLQLFDKTGERKYFDAAARMIEQLKGLQLTESTNPDLRGGLPGSYPINGGYAAYALPNWGVKFFADALLLKSSHTHNLPSH